MVPASVVGMREIPKDASVTWVTVSETPETATEPFSATYRASPAGSSTTTSSHRGPGVRETIRPTPSTCPCTMCPSSLPPAGTARSRFTGAPATFPPSVLRRNVSGITSTANVPSATSVTVRHTPSTAIE